MSKLAVRTKGDSSPQGKARVYFSCHPEDFSLYFETICGDIFETQNCAIYYEEEWDKLTDTEELASQLSDMQLFVVPVTTKYLFQSNRAADYEYAFAMQHHIPILPIAMESGLNVYFPERMNRIRPGYGDVQYLDRTSTDRTEISYAEKLEKRLNAIIIGDALAERVRAAFDAYIFMSYRKKDRVYAKQLMEMIHRIPFCRDIAIWYDEFLIPGEAWSQAIAEAMEKSSLVTLAVTPNITEPNNYIIEHEYQDARKLGKDIVPTEMVETEREELKRLFPGLPELIAYDNAEALSEALKKVAVRRNDADPKHNFLIGLAYLGGIDVERNTGYATELITSAAESGLDEAIAKLVSMYRIGEGVERDYHRAIEWQRKLVDIVREKWQNGGKEEDGYTLFNVLWDLGDYLSEIADLAAAQKVYEEMKQHARYMLEQIGTREARQALSVSYNKLGDIMYAQSNLENARDYYEEHLKISRKLAEETGAADERLVLAISCDRLGILASASGKLESAEGYFRESLEIYRQLLEEVGTAEVRNGLGISYERLGDSMSARGNLEEAQLYYEQSMRICRILAEETGTAESRSNLAISCNRRGNIEEAWGNLQKARVCYEEGLKIYRELVEETGTVDVQEGLAVSCNHVGDIERALENSVEAQSYYKESMRIRQKLAEETGTADALRAVSVSCDKLGDMEKSQGNLQKARIYYGKGLRISRRLADMLGTVEARRDLSISCERMGDIAQEAGDLEKAQRYYRKSLQISKELAAGAESVEARRDLSMGYDKMGDIAHKQDNLKAAQAYYKKALEIWRQLAEETKTARAYDDVAIGYYKLSQVDVRHKKENMKKALRIWKVLSKQNPEISWYRKSYRLAGKEYKELTGSFDRKKLSVLRRVRDVIKHKKKSVYD